ncbi:hypothetical protein JHJ32_21135 [Parapedobacter sp. ISTM3]|uniref:hypothetical protein n=1 Tax=Parapedobacter sp. ISTM3 TaxID=2800130 RepID=UPI00190846EE|nr:hypothetical protein [Parapedobacter sp. ISTM3]MBK1442517.1 hypothetical protein [Parapedobacter sp. ISTM3]
MDTKTNRLNRAVSSRILLFFFFAASCFSAYGQTTATVNTGGTGWKRIAYVNGSAGRGFGTVSLYIPGGDFTPQMTTISWFHDWSNSGGITVSSNSRHNTYWTACRITNDGTNSYLEVNFSTHLSGLQLISDNYGWRVATLYSGTLPNGGGTVRALANVARLSVENHLVVANNGRVGIGTASPQAKLAVDGNILAKEVKVKTDITVPDYVFEEGYELPTLSEIAAYVKQHKHLPEIPSAKDIENNGLDLAEMNLLLLKKVEELTLHLIEKDKENKFLQDRLSTVEQHIGIKQPYEK